MTEGPPKYRSAETIAYYDEQARAYDAGSYYTERTGYYPANFYRLQLTRQIIDERLTSDDLEVLDAGCGTGEITVHMAEKGLRPHGCDFSEEMVAVAREKLETFGLSENILQADITQLDAYGDEAFDAVFVMGVLPYLPEEIEGGAYQELCRVLKPGGLFVSAHENELFDVFTFNKYTVRFFQRNILPMLRQVDPGVDADELVEGLSSLMTNPLAPQERDAAKAPRDIIFTKSENPLAYAEKIAQFGLQSNSFRYYHFHALPPLARNSEPKWLELSKKLEVTFASDWQAMFMCSTFVNIAVKGEM